MIQARNNNAAQSQWRLNKLMPMSDNEYGLWLALLEQRTGITLPELRKSFLLSKLSIRMQELGISEYRRYYAYVTHGRAGRVEWETLVDRLTVHETRFFRDTRALSFIRERFLDKYTFAQNNDSIQLWSVGCATGEEPYSLMMYIDKYINDRNEKCYLSVTASDISHDALAFARKARYHKSRFSNVPAEYMEAYLHDCGDDHYQVDESIRKRVCFNRLNLVDMDSSSIGDMDIIVCQNVLIYFRRETRLEILEQLVEHLQPGGLLILGAGEITMWKHPLMKLVRYNGVLAFQRITEDEQLSSSRYDA